MFISLCNNLCVYLKLCYDANKTLLRLCSNLTFYSNLNTTSEDFIYISSCLCRIISFHSLSKSRKAVLSQYNESIISFSNEFSFLNDDIIDLFTTHNDILYRIKKLRNKSEHSPHEMNTKFILTGNNKYCSIEFEIDSELIYIDTNEIMKLLTSLNIIFDKMINILSDHAISNSFDNLAEYYNIDKIISFRFETFNRIYNNDNITLYDVSRVINDF